MVEEVDRILNEDGDFVFTDLMATQDCPEEILEPVLERIHLETLGSFGFYVEQARKLGFNRMEVTDFSDQLTMHYQRVSEETRQRYDELVEACGKEYIDRMLDGLKHWVEAGKKNYLSWGIVHLDKEDI